MELETWKPINTAPSDMLIMTAIIDCNGERNVKKMTKQGNLWFSGGMYVYYTPTHWKYM